MANRTRILIVVLVLIIVVLAGIMLYVFAIKPKISGYVVERQREGVVIAVNSILAQLQQQGFVQIPLNQNQSIILVPYVPPQQITQPVGETPQ